MNEAAALERLRQMVDAASDPVIDEIDLADLLTQAKVPDGARNLPTNVDTAPAWSASTQYLHGQIVTANPAAGRWWRCLNPGTSGTTQPTWPDLAGQPASGLTVDDGSVTWQDVGSEWSPTWDLDHAAAVGWERKAGRVAGRYDFTTDGQTFRRGQLLDHCTAMAKMYRRKVGRIL